jgi:chromosome segregation ATPase
MKSASGYSETRTKVTLKDYSSDPPDLPLPVLEQYGVASPSRHRDQRKGFLSRIAELKLDILSLRQKADVMRHESARIKAEKIKPAELLVIQSQVQFHATETQATGLYDLINEFQEANRAISRLRSICCNTERLIFNAEQLRESILGESDLLSDALNFHGSSKHQSPKFLGCLSNRKESCEIESLERHLNRLHRELRADARFDTVLSSDAFMEVNRAAKARADRDGLGLDDLRAEVSELQEAVANSDRQLRILAKANRRQRSLLKEVHSRTIEEPKIPDFDKKCQKLDARIAEKRTNLERIINSVISVTDEISRLRGVPRIQSSLRIDFIEEDSTTSETSESVNELRMMTEQIEKGLLEQRNVARRELSEMERRYRELKRELSEKESEMIDELRVLKGRLGAKGCGVDLDDGKSMEVLSMMSKIEDSLQALKSDLL